MTDNGVPWRGRWGSGAPRRGRWGRLGRRARVLLCAGAAVVLVGAGLTGTWAAEAWPFAKARYCWGAWEEGGTAPFLGGGRTPDEVTRTAKETAPTSSHPRGSCAVTVAGEHRDWTVRVEFGPVPAAPAARARWAAAYLGARTVPLPDGLPGTVGRDRAMLVLPAACAAGGRPAAVTVRADSEANTPGYEDSSGLGGPGSVARLLTHAANTGAERSGCAPAEPWHVTSPVDTSPDPSDSSSWTNHDGCGIPGLRAGKGTADSPSYRIGTAGPDLQSCELAPGEDEDEDADESPSGETDADDDAPGRTFLMVADPRLTPLVDGLAGKRSELPGLRGTHRTQAHYTAARATCDGRQVTFLAHPAPSAAEFAAFADSAAQRLDCPPLTRTKGATR